MTNAFSIVGLMVVGCMASTRITVNTPFKIAVGSGVVKFQEILNSLLPGLIPLAITLIVWKLVSKKINVTWIVIGIFIVGIAASYLGVLGFVG